MAAARDTWGARTSRTLAHQHTMRTQPPPPPAHLAQRKQPLDLVCQRHHAGRRLARAQSPPRPPPSPPVRRRARCCAPGQVPPAPRARWQALPPGQHSLLAGPRLLQQRQQRGERGGSAPWGRVLCQGRTGGSSSGGSRACHAVPRHAPDSADMPTPAAAQSRRKSARAGVGSVPCRPRRSIQAVRLPLPSSGVGAPAAARGGTGSTRFSRLGPFNTDPITTAAAGQTYPRCWVRRLQRWR